MSVRYYYGKRYLLSDTKQLAILNSIGVLLKGVSNDLHAPNFMHVKTSLRIGCVHARNRAHNLSSPANDIEDVIKAASKIRDHFNNLLKANNFKEQCLGDYLQNIN